MYQGCKLLLLVPVTLLLCYVLFNHWSMQFRAWASFRPTDSAEHAHFAKLDVVHKTGLVHEAHKVYLCKVYHYYYQGKYYQQIEFENEKYNIVAGDGKQYKLEQHYQKVGSALPATDVERGLSSQEHYENMNKYGENRIILKYPVYIKILLDEILSPYFAFQVFCSVLYALDNFATYSLFSIVFLFFTEGANVYSKYNSLKQTCKLAPKPTKVKVLRNGEAAYTSSASLVPGDIVLYNKKEYDQMIEEQE